MTRTRHAVIQASVAESRDAVAIAACSALEADTTALARIWLRASDHELRLVASSGRPLGGGSYHRVDGEFGIIRGDSGKLGRIAATREELIVCGLRSDEPWLENPGWVARQGIRSFVGLPLIAADAVCGVLALFDRRLISDEALDDLRFLAAVVAARCDRLQRSPVS